MEAVRVTSGCHKSFCERLAGIVNKDLLARRSQISLSAEQVSSALRLLGLRLENGRVPTAEVFRLCSEIARVLDSGAWSCRGFIVCNVLKNIIEKNQHTLVAPQ